MEQQNEMSYFLYILKCKDNSYYTGITWNIEKRLKEHNSRINTCLQKSKVPAELAYWKEFDNIKEAAKKEKEVKGWRREKKEELIKSLH